MHYIYAHKNHTVMICMTGLTIFKISYDGHQLILISSYPGQGEYPLLSGTGFSRSVRHGPLSLSFLIIMIITVGRASPTGAPHGLPCDRAHFFSFHNDSQKYAFNNKYVHQNITITINHW